MLRLLKFELYKVYRQKSIYILFALLIGIISLSFNFDREREQAVLQEYQPWEGKITADKLAQIDVHKQEIEKKMDDETYNMSLDDSVLYSISESFSIRKQKMMEREQEITKLTTLINDAPSAFKKRNALIHTDLLRKVDTSNFYYQKGPSNMIDMIYTFGFVITAFMLIIGISPIFSKEYSSGMDQFLLSSKYGRSKLVTAKLLAAIIFTVSIAIGWIAYSAAISIYSYGSHGWSAPLQSMHEHLNAPYPFTLGESYALMISMHLLAAIALALIIVFVSAICKRILMSLLVSGFIFGLPFVIDVVPGFEWLEEFGWISSTLNLSIYHLMKVKNQFIAFETYNMFGFPVLYPIVAVVLSVITATIFAYLTKWVLKRKQVAV
ncbi:hypothetical protein [Bacillus sp. FSL K6-3431]|uniref:hypothetical protein n=1 Tax=Bacillus sp. FSL K6-3431 TaxID=2921500 RepID=UPI0030FB177C